MSKFKSECLISAAAIMSFAGHAAAQCPSLRNNDIGAPLIPAVTRIEIENPSAPSKPYLAVAGNPNDRAQTTGGVLGKSTLTLVVTLSSEVASGCELPFTIYDPIGPIENRLQPYSERTFPIIDGQRAYLRGIANGSNKVKLTLPVAIQLGSRRTQRHRLGLSSPYTSQTPETPVLFEFDNNPIRIASIFRVGTSAAPARPGDRVEIGVTIAEPLDPASRNYTFLTDDGNIKRSQLKVRYTLSPSNLARPLSVMNADPIDFVPGFTDGSSRVAFFIKDNPASNEPTKVPQVAKLPTRPTLNGGPVAPTSGNATQSAIVSAQLYTEITREGGETLSVDIPVN